MDIPEQLLFCGKCNDKLKIPKLLPCLHTVCSKCLFDEKKPLSECPSCNSPIVDLDSTTNLPDDNFTKSLLNYADVTEDNATPLTEKEGEELKIQQNGVNINLKKLRLQSEEACHKAFTDERKYRQTKEKASNDIKEYFKNLQQKIAHYLRDQESDLLRQLDESLADEAYDISQSVIWNKSVLGSIEDKEELLEKFNVASITSSAKAAAFKDILYQMDVHISHIGGSIQKYERPKLEVVFKESHSDDFFKNPLGKIEVIKSGSKITMPQEVQAIQRSFKPFKKAEYVRTFSSLLQDDAKGYVVGIAWIPPDRLVLVDKWNKKVKLFNENGILINVMLFSGGEPTDITYTKNDRCLITLPGGRLIMQIAVEDQLKISSRIATVTGYSALAYDKTCSKIICGVCTPYGSPRIDIVNANGSVHFSIAMDIQRVPLFVCPRSVDISEYGIIAGCDWKKNRLLFLGRDGTVRGSYYGSAEMPLIDPVGTTPDGRGNILVADSRMHRIHVVSFGGKFVFSFDTSEHVMEPREINLLREENSAKLAVSHGAGYISIYRLTHDD